MKEWNLKLPCKLGDTVYGIGMIGCSIDKTGNLEEKRKIAQICRVRKGACERCEYNIPKIEEYVCTLIEIDKDGIWICGEKCESYNANDIFTDKAKAEEKVKELLEKMK